jgi:peptide/nickel transport system permease protein
MAPDVETAESRAVRGWDPGPHDQTQPETGPTSASGRRPRGQLWLTVRAFGQDRAAVVALLFIALVCAASAAAEVISPWTPEEAAPAVGRYAPVGTPEHLLGTDQLGRDVLTRLLWGGRVSIPVAVLPLIAAAFVGLLLGMLAAFGPKRPGAVTMRTLDVLFAFPPVLVAIAVGTILGPGLSNVMLAIGVMSIPYMTRVVYVEAVSVRGSDYIRAARVLGTPMHRLLSREVLPNVLPPLIVFASTGVGGMIVMGAGLSFLGIGVQPPTPDWGIMTSDGKGVLLQSPTLATIPGLLIVAVAIAFNFVGDGLADALDPTRRKRRWSLG